MGRVRERKEKEKAMQLDFNSKNILSLCPFGSINNGEISTGMLNG